MSEIVDGLEQLSFNHDGAVLLGQASETIYGPYIRAMVARGDRGVGAGELEEPYKVVDSLGVAARLFVESDAMYRGDNPDALSGEELIVHQDNVLRGVISLVPESAAMTTDQGILQVVRANDALCKNPHLQAVIAALNYAFFSPDTMAAGTETLRRRATLLDIDTLEAMPHLTVSNWAIGQIVSGIYKRLAEQSDGANMHLIDIGSGHGGTLATSIDSMRTARDNLGAGLPAERLAMTCVETTPEFYEQLTAFADGEQGISDLGLSVQYSDNYWHEQPISQPGVLNLIKGDAVEALAGLESTSLENTLTVVTGNYSWHRLSSLQKQGMIEALAARDNSIFIIGDLAQNGSTVNRRYFNLGFNGPLNAGNRELEELFISQGFSLVDISEQRPSGLDPDVARKLIAERVNDGHLWIAYKGNSAEEALDLLAA